MRGNIIACGLCLTLIPCFMTGCSTQSEVKPDTMSLAQYNDALEEAKANALNEILSDRSNESYTYFTHRDSFEELLIVAHTSTPDCYGCKSELKFYKFNSGSNKYELIPGISKPFKKDITRDETGSYKDNITYLLVGDTDGHLRHDENTSVHIHGKISELKYEKGAYRWSVVYTPDPNDSRNYGPTGIAHRPFDALDWIPNSKPVDQVSKAEIDAEKDKGRIVLKGKIYFADHLNLLSLRGETMTDNDYDRYEGRYLILKLNEPQSIPFNDNPSNDPNVVNLYEKTIDYCKLLGHEGMYDVSPIEYYDANAINGKEVYVSIDPKYNFYYEPMNMEADVIIGAFKFM